MKKNARFLSLTMALLLIVSLLAACGSGGSSSQPSAQGSSGTDDKIKVALVTDMAVDEAEWLQNLVAGLDDYQAEHTNIEVKVIEATQSSEYEPKTRAAAQAGYDIIITTNSSMADATVNVANDFPNLQIVVAHGCYPWIPMIFQVAITNKNVWLLPDIYIWHLLSRAGVAAGWEDFRF